MKYLVPLIILAILFYKYPEQMKRYAIIIILAITLFFTGIYMSTVLEERDKDNIILSVAYDLIHCSVDKPLYVSIENKTSKTLNKVRWNIDIYQSGHSDNIANYSTNSFASDKILAQEEKYSSCLVMPKLTRKVESDLLSYKISNKFVTFR